MTLLPAIAAVTDRVIGRSGPPRRAYLELMEAERERGASRAALGCANLFAKQSRGDVHVASEIGGATALALHLPPVEAEAHRPAARRIRKLPRMDAAHASLSSKTTYKSASSRHRRSVSWATTASSRRTRLVRCKSWLGIATGFHIVFPDVVMPGMSGIELGAEIRRRYPHVLVVLASGHSDVLAQNAAHRLNLLHKPTRLSNCPGRSSGPGSEVSNI